MKTLLNDLHDIIEQGDNGTPHDLIDVMFNLLDVNLNTTKTQMKMFLTRLGKNSQMIIVGDITQIDLVSEKDSGLKDAIKKLKKISDIGFIELDEKDVVRHDLVKKIINAYEKNNNS